MIEMNQYHESEYDICKKNPLLTIKANFRSTSLLDGLHSILNCTLDLYSIAQEICTRFLLCCALLWLYIVWFPHIHQVYFTGTVAI